MGGVILVLATNSLKFINIMNLYFGPSYLAMLAIRGFSVFHFL